MTGLVATAPLYSVTDADTLSAHLVAEEAMISGRLAGCYRAVCGDVVLAASLTAQERAYCQKCARRRAGR